MDNEKYYMWLSRIGGLGIKKQERLLEVFEDPLEIFNAPKELLEKVEGLGNQLVQNILENQDKDLVESYIKQLNEKNIRFISKHNEEYPSLLKEIDDAPLGLYMLGELPQDELNKLSIIGSRRCSEYGLTIANKFSKSLGEYNVVVVSGMAKGIDSMAHKGALEGGGLTIAVLGCGIDICYPPENRNLSEKIIKNGCVISEYPPGVQPLPAYFPMRNRIISGLSKATLVIEAAKRSGTLITIDRAMEQGRDVLAVPGNITSKSSQGTNEMIKDGACMVTCFEDILNYLNIEVKKKFEDNNITKTLSPDEKLIYNCIQMEPVSINYIINKCKVQPQTANYLITMLEMKGAVIKTGGGGYIRSCL